MVPFIQRCHFKRANVILRMLSLLVVLFFAASDAKGQIIAWTNTGSTTAWYTDTNWAPSTTFGAWTTSNIAQFNNTGTATTAGINMTTSSLSIGAIEITSLRTRALTIGSSATTGNLTLNGATVNTVSNVVLRNASGFILTLQNNETGSGKTMNVVLGNATNNVVLIEGIGSIAISSNISGVGRQLTLQGALASGSGALILSGTNTYSGGTTVATGSTLSFRLTAAKPTTGTHTFNSGSALGLGITGTGSFTTTDILNAFAGTFTGNLAGISLDANANIAIDIGATATNFSANIGPSTRGLEKMAGTANLTLTGANQYSGRTVVNSASGLVVQNLGNIGDASSNIGTADTIDLKTGAFFQISNITPISSNKHINLAGTGNLVLFAAGSAAGNTITLTGNVSSSTAGSKTFDLRTSTSFGYVHGGVISDGSGVVSVAKSQTGSWVLSGTNTYTGTTTVGAGILRITNSSALGSTVGGTTQSGTSALELDGTGGALTIGAESLTINGGGISNAGALRNIAGNNTYGGTVTMAATSRIMSDSGTLLLNNPTAITGAFNLAAGGSGNITISGAMTNGTGGVIKDGTGTLTLSGANTFTGVTDVRVGTLLLDMTAGGVLAPTSALTLGSSTFRVKGASSGVTAQTLGALVLSAGTSSTISLDPNGGTSTTLTLGDAWTRGVGANLFIDYSSASTGIREVITANPTTGLVLTNGIYAGITVKDSAGVTGFATRAAGTNQPITRFDDTTGTTLVDNSDDATVNFTTLNTVYTLGVLDWINGPLTNRSVNSLTIDTTNNGGTINMGDAANILTLTSGSILFKGPNNLTLTGGQVGAAASDVAIHQVGTGVLTIVSPISSGTGSLTKTGGGSLILNNNQTYTGTTSVGGGLLHIIGTLNGGTYASAITVGTGATFHYDNNSDQTLSGAFTGLGGLTKSGSGVLTLSSATTSYAGPTNLIAGTLSLVSTTAFASPITVNAGTTLRYAPTGNVNFASTAATVNLQGDMIYNTAGNFYQVLGAPVTINAAANINLTAAPVTTFSTGLFLDGGLQGSSNLTITSNSNGVGLVLRTVASTYSGTMIVNGNPSSTIGLGSGLAINGPVSLSNANLTINGTLELGNAANNQGWATLGAGPNGVTLSINTLAGTGVIVANMQTANSTRTLSVGNNGGGGNFSGVIASGTNSTLAFSKVGTGTQILSGANTFTGLTVVSAGILQLDNSLALQNSPLDTLNSVAGNATNGIQTALTALTFGGLTGNKNLADVFVTGGSYSGITALSLSPNSSSNRIYTGIIADGTPGMTLSKVGSAQQTLSALNTYTGVTTIVGTGPGSFASALIVTVDGALGTAAAGTTVGPDNSLVISGGIDYATPELVSGSGAGTLNSLLAIVGTRGFIQGAAGNNIFRGNIELNANGESRIGSQDGGSLNLTGSITQASGISTASILFRVGGSSGDFVTLSNGGNSFGGDSTVFTSSSNTGYAGVRLGITNGLPTNLTISGFTGSQATFTALDLAGFNQTLNGLITGGANLRIINLNTVTPSTLTLNPTADKVSTNTLILGGVGLGFINVVKEGTFVQTISGVNTYTGTTQINGGTLLINSPGSLAAGSAVTVGGASASGTPTLGGTGTINGTVTVATAGVGAAGTLLPGSVTTVGTLNVVNNVTFEAGSTLKWKITAGAPNGAAADSGLSSNTGSTTRDLLNITGGTNTLTTTGAAIFDLTQIGGTVVLDPNTAYSFTVATTASTPNVSGFTVSTTNAADFAAYAAANGGLNLVTLSASGNNVYLNLTPVPEPGTILALSTGLLGLGGYIRRKRNGIAK